MAKPIKKQLKTEHSILNIPTKFEELEPPVPVELPKEIKEKIEAVVEKATVCDRCGSNTTLISEDEQGKEYKCPNCNKGLSLMRY